MAGAKQIGQVASEKGSKILGSLGGTTSTLFFGINAFMIVITKMIKNAIPNLYSLRLIDIAKIASVKIFI